MQHPTPSTQDKEERNWAMLAHLSALLTYATLIGGIIAPLVIWLIRKDQGGFAAEQAKESLNFQITVFLIAIPCWILCLLLIGFILLWILAVINLILVIVATVKTGQGIPYRYPFNLRLVS